MMGPRMNEAEPRGGATTPTDGASGSPSRVATTPGVAVASARPAVGQIVLRPEQAAQVEQDVAALDLATMSPGDVVKIGLDAERSLQQTLDGFLARLDRRTAATVFALFDRLAQGVDDAKLPEILAEIQKSERPGPLAALLGRLRGKSRDEILREMLERLGDLVAGRTRTLADEMTRLEADLETEMRKLSSELETLETLKRSYGEHFAEFAVAAAVAQAFLERARAAVTAEEAKLDPADVVGRTRVQELRDKLRLLESRALALEGTYSRLPADQLVIQQIEQAGVSTLQETATTVASRFASIKMTLLSVHGAFAVKNVQALAGRQAQLDRQLTDIRGRALKDVAVAAALAPGEGRLAQAQQLEQIIASTKEIHDLVEAARKTSDEKLELARQRFAAARAELAALAATRPAA